MAIGHIAVRAHSRAKGHSAAAAIAYRFGEALTCSRTGERHDFSRRSQRADVAACGLSPGPFGTAGALATAIEDAERRRNSRLLRDVQIALPAELDEAARTALAERFAGELAARYGTVTAWAVHRPDRRSDARNHHAHIVLPTRSLDEHGKFGKKIRSLDDRKRGPEEIEAIRALWEARANEALHAADVAARVHTGRTTDPEPTLGATHTAIERRAWSKRHRGQTPPAMSAAELVRDDVQCATGRGRRLAHHGARRALIEHALGRHAPQSVPVPEAAPEPVTALEPVPDAHRDPDRRTKRLTFPRAPMVALEPVPAAEPDETRTAGRVERLSVPSAPVVALKPVPAAEPEPRPVPMLFTEPDRLDLLRLEHERARAEKAQAKARIKPEIPEPPPPKRKRDRKHEDDDWSVRGIIAAAQQRTAPAAQEPVQPKSFLETWLDEEEQSEAEQSQRTAPDAQETVRTDPAPAALKSDAARGRTEPEEPEMTVDLDTARRRRGPAVQAHADTHGRAPTTDEISTAEQYLEGGHNAASSSPRPSLAAVVDRIAKARLDGSTPVESDSFSRWWRIHRELEPHTRERPQQENEHQLDRENCGACRSPRGAETAAKLVAKALDEYQSRRYGIDKRGNPATLPPGEMFRAWTKTGTEKKRLHFIAETIERWRKEIAPKVLKRVLMAIVPIEVQFRRNLKRQRETSQATAEARRREIGTVQSRPVVQPGRGGWNRD